MAHWTEYSTEQGLEDPSADRTAARWARNSDRLSVEEPGVKLASEPEQASALTWGWAMVAEPAPSMMQERAKQTVLVRVQPSVPVRAKPTVPVWVQSWALEWGPTWAPEPARPSAKEQALLKVEASDKDSAWESGLPSWDSPSGRRE